MKLGKHKPQPFRVNKELRQGCCLSSTLFKIFLEEILRGWKKKQMGIQIYEKLATTSM
jgi:hypothetical protein